MRYSIKHTPMCTNNQIDITIDNVEKLYDGKGNCCRCGCGGEYYYNTEENSAIIKDCLDKMASGKFKVESIDNNIFEIVLKKWKTKSGLQLKVQTIYLNK